MTEKCTLSETGNNAVCSTSLPALNITYRQYADETDLPLIMRLVDNELSEPYSIFTYRRAEYHGCFSFLERYFLHNWSNLCQLAFDGPHCFGTVVCKMDMHGALLRGYLAMLVVETSYRGHGVGTALVRRVVEEMVRGQADEVVLEAEVTNTGALALYQNLGFIRDKRLVKYYLNGADAFRLKLMLPMSPERLKELEDEALVADQLTTLSLSPPRDLANVEQDRAAARKPEGS